MPNGICGLLVNGMAGIKRLKVAVADPLAARLTELVESDDVNFPVPSRGTHRSRMAS